MHHIYPKAMHEAGPEDISSCQATLKRHTMMAHGAVMTISQIIKVVLSSAAEAEAEVGA